MSRRSVGKEHERQCKKQWKQNGWLVDFKFGSRWNSEDLFGMFDFVAVKGNRVVFVQVKTADTDFYKARKEVQEFLNTNKLEIEAQVWQWRSRKPWRVANMTPHGYDDNEIDRSLEK
jgi:Holliday junction resolvase